MSLEQLSASSLKRIFFCLDYQYELGSIVFVRRTSFQVNEVAKTIGFDKIKAVEVRLALTRKWARNALRQQVVEHAVVTMLQIQRRNWNIHDQGFPSSSDVDYDVDLMARPGLPSFFQQELNEQIVQKQNYADDVERDEFIRQMLHQTLDKVRDFRMFSLFEMTINSPFLSMLKEVLSSVRRTKTVVLNIQRCEINLTSEELTQLFDLFPNATSVCLEGTFSNNSLTDKHLSRATDNLRIAHDSPICRNIVERDFQPFSEFSGITENFLSQKNGAYPKIFTLDGFFSNISFAALWRIMLNSVKTIPGDSGIKPILSNMYFGELSGTQQLHTDIVKAQRITQFKWNIFRATQKTKIYQVYSKHSTVFLTFSVTEPTSHPDFKKILIQHVCSKVTDISYALYEYEWRNKIPDKLINRFEIMQLNHTYREIFSRTNVMLQSTDEGERVCLREGYFDPLFHKQDRMRTSVDVTCMVVDEEAAYRPDLGYEGLAGANALPGGAVGGDLVDDVHNDIRVLDARVRRFEALRENAAAQKALMLNNLNALQRKLQLRISQVEAMENVNQY